MVTGFMGRSRRVGVWVNEAQSWWGEAPERARTWGEG